MKKTYKNPTLTVVKVQTANILAGSGPVLRGSTNATSGNAGRGASFSGWNEEEQTPPDLPCLREETLAFGFWPLAKY